MYSEFKVKDLPKQLTLAVRTITSVGELPEVIGKVYGDIITYLAELGEDPAGMPFVIYYNLDMANLDIEIGFPVSKKFPDKGIIKSSELPSGKTASGMHHGPYEEMKSTYDALTEWVENEGYEATGIAIEYYYNNPEEVSPEDVLTEIQFPLK
ncbi:MAG: Transcriptional regulator [Promethearchaeota archaeon]|nr:MAG: Transcriptional regulator [Candidatus Lokiarchaeota archaeon]